MPLGWIDFSKSERNKVLSVLDMLSEAGTLDELGIAPIRDGFADLFFPGTSTIRTRAKYFLIGPYALKGLEYGSEADPDHEKSGADTPAQCEPPENRPDPFRQIQYHIFSEKSTGNIAGLSFNSCDVD